MDEVVLLEELQHFYDEEMVRNLSPEQIALVESDAPVDESSSKLVAAR